jgi:hypothetical protein
MLFVRWHQGEVAGPEWFFFSVFVDEGAFTRDLAWLAFFLAVIAGVLSLELQLATQHFRLTLALDRVVYSL